MTILLKMMDGSSSLGREKTKGGPSAYAALSTVIDTAKLKGQAVFETLVNLMGLPVLQFLHPAIAIHSSA